jgi:NSS family neurotransmitter:Na+ symporter
VQRGIERAAKVLMPSLFIMLLVLVVFVLSLDNALDGARFFIVPDITKLNAGVINNALSQAFFSLSLGMGILITYGSYLDKKDNILKAGSMVAVADTSVAFIAGLLILPAIFSFNPQVNTAELSDSSVSLIFVLLPNIFLTLQDAIGFFGAHTIATVFFLLVFFAAITSLVSIIEVPVAYLIDEKNITRQRALMLLALTGGAFVIISALSFGALTVFTEFTTYADQSKSFFDVIIDVFYDTILALNGL